jgi:RNA polymerase sigma-70 factor (ECF subfamily)
VTEALPVAAASAVAAAGAESYSRIVAGLIRVTGKWTLAEECAQEALALALERWPKEGVPASPNEWLMTVARNRAIDNLTEAGAERGVLGELAALSLGETEPVGADAGSAAMVDDRIRLIFMCCHPALPFEARMVLTLRTLCAVPIANIAKALLVTEAVLNRCLTQAKAKIADAGIPNRMPSGPALTERLRCVLSVLHALFIHGHDAKGEPAFSEEAICLARLLQRLMPGQSEVSALLALFLFQDSRREARRDPDGRRITLETQDRTRWDADAIAEGMTILSRVSPEGPYGLQARIAACHATATSPKETDWREIAICYDELARIQSTPAIELNRAVAHSYAYGAAVGLALLAEARAGAGLDDYPHSLAAGVDLTPRPDDRLRRHIVTAGRHRRS